MALKVLIVDDEELIRELLVETVEPLLQKGGEVLQARDGQEALEIFQSRKIDVIVTDIRMPRLDGEALISAIGEATREIPVLVITGHGDKRMAERLRTKGIFAFLEKPFETAILEKTVKEAIHKRRELVASLS